MTIRPDTAKEELDAARLLDFFFVCNAFRFQIRCVAVQDIDILRINIDMREEVFVHEAVVTLGMIPWDAHIFVLA